MFTLGARARLSLETNVNTPCFQGPTPELVLEYKVETLYSSEGAGEQASVWVRARRREWASERVSECSGEVSEVSDSPRWLLVHKKANYENVSEESGRELGTIGKSMQEQWMPLYFCEYFLSQLQMTDRRFRNSIVITWRKRK